MYGGFIFFDVGQLGQLDLALALARPFAFIWGFVDERVCVCVFERSCALHKQKGLNKLL